MDPKETGITFIATRGGGNISGTNGAGIFNLGYFGAFRGTRVRMNVSRESKGCGR